MDAESDADYNEIYVLNEKFITFSRGSNKNIKSCKHPSNSSSLFKYGVCPICNKFFTGLKKHYSACVINLEKLKSDYLLFGCENSSSKPRVSKECAQCKKKYIFKHKC